MPLVPAPVLDAGQVMKRGRDILTVFIGEEQLVDGQAEGSNRVEGLVEK